MTHPLAAIRRRYECWPALTYHEERDGECVARAWILIDGTYQVFDLIDPAGDARLALQFLADAHHDIGELLQIIDGLATQIESVSQGWGSCLLCRAERPGHNAGCLMSALEGGRAARIDEATLEGLVANYRRSQ